MSEVLFQRPSRKNYRTKADCENQARDMLDAFHSVGVERFVLTATDIKGVRRYRPEQHEYAPLRKIIGYALGQAHSAYLNILVRPLPGPAPLLQLDNLGMDRLPTFFEASFLMVYQAPNSYAAWFAVEGDTNGFCDRFYNGTKVENEVKATVHLSGSRNVQPNFAVSFPHVQNAFVAIRRTVQPAVLEALGVVPPPVATATPATEPACGGTPSPWPGWQALYEDCLNSVCPTEPGTRDKNEADWLFCCELAKQGFGAADICTALVKVSENAARRQDDYVVTTVQIAVARSLSTEKVS